MVPKLEEISDFIFKVTLSYLYVVIATVIITISLTSQNCVHFFLSTKIIRMSLHRIILTNILNFSLSIKKIHGDIKDESD